MNPWQTTQLPADPDAVSPSGGSEIRNLPSFEQGELAHATARDTKPSGPGTLSGAGELFYVLSGDGEIWRGTGDLEDVTPLIPRRCVEIPPGIDYQYRAVDAPLAFLVMTAPRWRRDVWRDATSCGWDVEGSLVSNEAKRPGPWQTVDLARDCEYLAPDGSEIRQLITYDSGGLAHCVLPAGHASASMRHRTVVEIWYVLSGAGEVWRSNGRDEQVVHASEGTVLTVPTGTGFQFRSAGETALEIMIATFPRWPGPTDAEPVEGHWAASARGT